MPDTVTVVSPVKPLPVIVIEPETPGVVVLGVIVRPLLAPPLMVKANGAVVPLLEPPAVTLCVPSAAEAGTTNDPLNTPDPSMVALPTVLPSKYNVAPSDGENPLPLTVTAAYLLWRYGAQVMERTWLRYTIAILLGLSFFYLVVAFGLGAAVTKLKAA